MQPIPNTSLPQTRSDTTSTPSERRASKSRPPFTEMVSVSRSFGVADTRRPPTLNPEPTTSVSQYLPPPSRQLPEQPYAQHASLENELPPNTTQASIQSISPTHHSSHHSYILPLDIQPPHSRELPPTPRQLPTPEDLRAPPASSPHASLTEAVHVDHETPHEAQEAVTPAPLEDPKTTSVVNDSSGLYLGKLIVVFVP